MPSLSSQHDAQFLTHPPTPIVASSPRKAMRILPFTLNRPRTSSTFTPPRQLPNSRPLLLTLSFPPQLSSRLRTTGACLRTSEAQLLKHQQDPHHFFNPLSRPNVADIIETIRQARQEIMNYLSDGLVQKKKRWNWFSFPWGAKAPDSATSKQKRKEGKPMREPGGIVVWMTPEREKKFRSQLAEAATALRKRLDLLHVIEKLRRAVETGELEEVQKAGLVEPNEGINGCMLLIGQKIVEVGVEEGRFEEWFWEMWNQGLGVEDEGVLWEGCRKEDVGLDGRGKRVSVLNPLEMRTLTLEEVRKVHNG